MGVNLCCLWRSSSREQRPATDGSNGAQLNRDGSFPGRIKPDRSRVEKKAQVHPKVTKITKVTKRVTLEEWLLASPAARKDGTIGSVTVNASENTQVSKQPNNKICPWMSNSSSPYVEIPPHFSLARDSFTLERSRKGEEENADGGMITPSMSRSQSGKLKKRVSFRLPEEADIIFFYSPELGDVYD